MLKINNVEHALKDTAGNLVQFDRQCWMTRMPSIIKKQQKLYMPKNIVKPIIDIGAHCDPT